MNELSPYTRALLDGYKHDVLPSARRDALNWTKIERRIMAAEPPLFDDESPDEAPEEPEDQRSTLPLLLVPLFTVAAAAAVMLVFDWGSLSTPTRDALENRDAAPFEWAQPAQEGTAERRQRAGASHRPSDVDHGITTPTERDAAPSPAAAGSTKPVAEVTTPPTPRRPRPRPKSTDARPGAADGVGAEASLLGRARAALRDGRPRDALRHAAEHSRRFPRGSLAMERRVLEIAARCDAGQRSRARKEAERFLREHPRSPLAARVRTICVQ